MSDYHDKRQQQRQNKNSFAIGHAESRQALKQRFKRNWDGSWTDLEPAPADIVEAPPAPVETTCEDHYAAACTRLNQAFAEATAAYEAARCPDLEDRTMGLRIVTFFDDPLILIDPVWIRSMASAAWRFFNGESAEGGVYHPTSYRAGLVRFASTLDEAVAHIQEALQ